MEQNRSSTFLGTYGRRDWPNSLSPSLILSLTLCKSFLAHAISPSAFVSVASWEAYSAFLPSSFLPSQESSTNMTRSVEVVHTDLTLL